MRRPFSLKSTLLLAFALSACLAASCSENGATSVCPPLPQHQAPFADGSAPDGAVAGAAAVDAQLARAEDAGCYTTPTFFPSDGGMGGAGPSPDGNGGAGGSGNGSSAGAAGTKH